LLAGAPGALFGSSLPPGVGVELGDELLLSAGGVDGVPGGDAEGDRSMLPGRSLTGPPLLESVHPAARPASRAIAQNPVRTFLIV